MNEENNPTMNGEKTYDERKTIRDEKKKLSETGGKKFLERKFQRHGERRNEIDMVSD